MREFGTAGDFLGSVAPGVITGGALLIGLQSKDDNFRSFSYTLAQAYATNFVLTQGIKLATDRMRPDKLGISLFPIGLIFYSFALDCEVYELLRQKVGNLVL